MSHPKLSVRQVERIFTGPQGEKTQALLPVDYQVNENDFITILGP
ncbi:ABC transporter ATP-binding protein, partial [Rahnella perminowiae]|nr:ABC transporter ATP-binding protein [Rahnella perminowiae]